MTTPPAHQPHCGRFQLMPTQKFWKSEETEYLFVCLFKWSLLSTLIFFDLRDFLTVSSAGRQAGRGNSPRHVLPAFSTGSSSSFCFWQNVWQPDFLNQRCFCPACSRGASVQAKSEIESMEADLTRLGKVPDRSWFLLPSDGPSLCPSTPITSYRPATIFPHRSWFGVSYKQAQF